MSGGDPVWRCWIAEVKVAHRGHVGDEGDDAHRALVLRAQQRQRNAAVSNMSFQITIKPSDNAFPRPSEPARIASSPAHRLYQATTLTDDERRAGLTLFCCAKPLTDLAIEVREVRRAGDISIKAPAVPDRVDSVLSKAAPGDAWPGRTGFVHQAVLDDFRDLSRYRDTAQRDFIGLRNLPAEEFFADTFTIAGESEARNG